MSVMRTVRTVLACLLLEAGTLMGAPMRMEEVEKLLRSLSEPQVAQTNPDEESDDEPAAE
jgi:hypothetical protein